MIEGVIYKYTSPSGKVYVGLTIDEYKRKREHKYLAEQNKDNMIFHKAIRKYGFENFLYEVVFKELFESIDICKDKLNKLELYYIELYDSYRNGYNSTLGGDTIRGYKWSEQARENHKREYLPHTEETKQKISDKLKGQMQSEETKIKRSNTLYNMNKGRVVELYSLDGLFIAEYSSAKRAAEKLGLTSYANIHNVCKGDRKTAFGYIWKYGKEK